MSAAPAADLGPLGLGCMRWGEGERDHTALVEAALEAGITLLDTADIYGAGRSEEVLGDVLRRSPGLRDRLFVATKAGVVPGVAYDGSAAHLVASCERSLARLGLECVDLFSVHRPDVFAHPEEVAGALERLCREGRTRHVGVSNHSPAQVDALAAFLDRPLFSTSPELSLLAAAALDTGVIDQACARGMAVLAWGPLAEGALATGRGLPGPLTEALDRIAERERANRAAIAVAWVMALPGRVVPLLGTTNPERLRALAQATAVRLDRSDLYALLQAARGEPLA